MCGGGTGGSSVGGYSLPKNMAPTAYWPKQTTNTGGSYSGTPTYNFSQPKIPNLDQSLKTWWNAVSGAAGQLGNLGGNNGGSGGGGSGGGGSGGGGVGGSSTPQVHPLALGNWGDLDRQWQLYSRDPDSFAPGTDMIQARQNFFDAGGYQMPSNMPIGGVGANPNTLLGGSGWLGNLTRNIGGAGSALPTPMPMR